MSSQVQPCPERRVAAKESIVAHPPARVTRDLHAGFQQLQLVFRSLPDAWVVEVPIGVNIR
jgi:hypothetical protein